MVVCPPPSFYTKSNIPCLPLEGGSVNIGEGTAIQGDFFVLDWANQQYALRVKIDAEDTNNFIDLDIETPLDKVEIADAKKPD